MDTSDRLIHELHLLSHQPGHEFVLALFNFVREKGHVSLLPELMQLTFKVP